jgi:integrase catalytic subunit
MVQEQYTTKRRKGQHLKLIERGKIEAFLKIGMSKVKIAEELGISVRTLHREIKRGMVELLNTDLSTREVYSAEFAQSKYDKAQKGKEGELKIGKNLKLVKYLEDSMKRGKNPPYAALEQAKREGQEVNIGLKTLYNYIHSGLFLEYSEDDMPYRKRRKKKVELRKRIRKQGGRSIEERDKRIGERLEHGHWEVDTVLGKKGTLACLLVLTERKTRLQLIRKLENRTALHTEGRIKGLIEEYPDSIKTLTSDNGSEFMKVDEIEGLGVGYFYAHSFSSWERGSNENNNKLIRRFIPKGTDITDIKEEELKSIEEWMNDYPRKLFNGKSSKEMYDIELKQYIS